LLEIKELIQPTILFQHIKAHQGTELSDKLNLQTNLNILMDARAKRMQQDVQQIPDWIRQNKYKILYNNETINGKIIKTFWQEISSTRMSLYYKHKFKEKYDNILWEPFIFAWQNGNTKKGILKMIHNIAPTQITLYRRHLSYDALCPIFCENEETTMHTFRYNGSNGVFRQHFCTPNTKTLLMISMNQ
jgi:hypothetical protein